MRKLAASLLAALALAAAAAPAGAETLNCTPINAVPAVITLPGVYCFTKSLVTTISTGKAIDIQANNVVLDMNGHRLGGLGAGLGTTADGIYSFNRQNITIRNGTVRGFLIGVRMGGSGGSQGHLVEDVRADLNTYTGIRVEGTGNIVRNNQVVATGGTTSGFTSAWGIVVIGVGARVINNDVITVTDGGGVSFGISITDGSDGLAVNNRITSADMGVQYAGSTGKYRDNLTSNVTTPYTGGTDAGNNN